MCNCKDIEIGEYGNQIMVLWPFGNSFICIDRCLLDEISLLWSQDIPTTGSCCGHNKQVGYIGVPEYYISKMKKLGYEIRFNETRPGAEDSFIPKTIIYW